MTNIAQSPCDKGVIARTRHADADESSTALCKKSAQTYVLAATILGSSMAFIDSTVVNVALAALQSTFHATAVDLQWVVEAYALFLAALLLVGGSLGDHFGRRRIYAPASRFSRSRPSGAASRLTSRT